MSADPLSGLWIVASACLVALTLPGSLELLLVTLGGLLPARRPAAVSGPGIAPGKVAVVVPAHNEEAGIARCVSGLLACEGAGEGFSVVVVADNCDDATAERAGAAGARVLVRNDDARRGKGYALDFAFGRLLDEGADALVVVDADSTAEPNLIAEIRRHLAAGADAVQAPYGVRNPGASLRTRLMNLALLAFNTLRPRGRDRWGLSAGILGNGFALSRETLLAVPYHARSVVEDLEYHLRLVRSGRRVRFAGRADIRADMPVGGKGVKTQRARWEGGRLRMLAESAPGLVKDILKGRLRLLEPLLDLLLLPLAFHVTALLALLAIPLDAARVYGAVGLGIVLAHILAAVLVGGGGIRDLAALAAAPFYVIWKAALLPAMLRTARKDAAWVRTERPSEGEKP